MTSPHLSRRNLFKTSAALGVAYLAPHIAQAQNPAKPRVLVQIELKGGNDGLNTVVPFTDPAYRSLRPKIALPEGDLLKLNATVALNAALAPLMPLWDKGELAIVQGVGYPQPNLSHFRSIEIWETASRSNQTLDAGWLTRAFAGPMKAQSVKWTADGVVVGSNELAGFTGGARAVALSNPEAFLRDAKFAARLPQSGNATLEHLLKTEADIQQAADGLRANKYAFKTEFPRGAFGNAVSAAAQVIASQAGDASPNGIKHIPVIHLQLGSFDTHINQLPAQANLLKQLAEGVAALKAALQELGRWDDTLVMTYSEFGRRPRENQSAGTDHGTVAPHFAMGGAVKGGIYGAQPSLTDLDSAGNMKFSVDFRQLYATVIERWWGVGSEQVLAGKFSAVPLLRT
jgi:uncharacterized protein (DUF1501 family)